MLTLGSFRNHDGDGGEDALYKLNLCFKFEFRNRVNRFSSPIGLKNLPRLNMHQQRSILKEDTKN